MSAEMCMGSGGCVVQATSRHQRGISEAVDEVKRGYLCSSLAGWNH